MNQYMGPYLLLRRQDDATTGTPESIEALLQLLVVGVGLLHMTIHTVMKSYEHPREYNITLQNRVLHAQCGQLASPPHPSDQARGNKHTWPRFASITPSSPLREMPLSSQTFLTCARHFLSDRKSVV